MGIDRLSNRVTFLTKTTTKDSMGSPSVTFTDNFTTGARLQQFSAQEAVLDDRQRVSSNALFVTTRRNPNTTTIVVGDFVRIDGNVWRVVGVDRVSFRRDSIRFIVDIGETA